MLNLESSFVGTSARSLLTAFLRTAIIESAKKTVLVPSFCCEAVFLSAYFAGASVSFIDVDSTTYSLDVSDLEKKITSDTVCIIVPHMFGYCGYSDELRRVFYQYRDIIWIDDACQTFLVSSVADNLNLFDQLDFRLSSFHSSKPLDGNMSLLECNTKDEKKLRIFKSSIQASDYSVNLKRDHEIRRMQGSYFTYLVSSYRLGLSGIQADSNIYNLFIDAYQYVIKPTEECIRKSIESYRLAICDHFTGPHLIINFCDQLLQTSAIIYQKPSTEERLWRLPLIFANPAQLEAVAFSLRQQNINVSNHYYSLEKIFSGTQTQYSCANSVHLSHRVLNLWFSDPAEVITAAYIINHSFS